MLLCGGAPLAVHHFVVRHDLPVYRDMTHHRVFYKVVETEKVVEKPVDVPTPTPVDVPVYREVVIPVYRHVREAHAARVAGGWKVIDEEREVNRELFYGKGSRPLPPRSSPQAPADSLRAVTDLNSPDSWPGREFGRRRFTSQWHSTAPPPPKPRRPPSASQRLASLKSECSRAVSEAAKAEAQLAAAKRATLMKPAVGSTSRRSQDGAARVDAASRALDAAWRHVEVARAALAAEQQQPRLVGDGEVGHKEPLRRQSPLMGVARGELDGEPRPSGPQRGGGCRRPTSAPHEAAAGRSSQRGSEAGGAEEELATRLAEMRKRHAAELASLMQGNDVR